MALNFQPPSFVQPNQYADLPRGLDDIFNTYLRNKALREQQQAAAEDRRYARFGQRMAFGGLDPATVTDDQFSAALRPPQAGPMATPSPAGGFPTAAPMGPTSQAPSNLAPQAGIPESVNVTKLRELFATRKNAAALASMEQMLGLKKTQAEIGKLQAAAAGGGLDAEARAKIENQITGDYFGNKAVTDFQSVRDAFRKITALSKKDLGIADIGTVYSFIKILDPGSAVREGETIIVQSANPGIQKLAMLWNQFVKGDVTPEQVKGQITEAARDLYKAQEIGYRDFRGSQVRRTQQYPGLNPDIVAPDLGIPEAEMAGLLGSQAAQAGGKPDMAARIRELSGRGLDRAAIKATLQKEGY